LAIGGSTVLNMVYDRDIDLKMSRTCRRSIPKGLVSVREALSVGLVLVGLGVGWAIAIRPLYGLVVFAGVFFDAVIYTIWLKRRTPWSIIWGGIAGGMPVLAGRVLGTGGFDLIGLLLTAAVLLWIPTHTVTFSLRHSEDYKRAGVPVFPNIYSERGVRLIIGASTGMAVLAMVTAAWLIGLHWGYFWAVLGLSVVLLGLTLISILSRSGRVSFALYKMASVYMLSVMVLIIAGL
jgi:protoheme IX farnesyltransferase